MKEIVRNFGNGVWYFMWSGPKCCYELVFFWFFGKEEGKKKHRLLYAFSLNLQKRRFLIKFAISSVADQHISTFTLTLAKYSWNLLIPLITTLLQYFHTSFLLSPLEGYPFCQYLAILLSFYKINKKYTCNFNRLRITYNSLNSI